MKYPILNGLDYASVHSFVGSATTLEVVERKWIAFTTIVNFFLDVKADVRIMQKYLKVMYLLINVYQWDNRSF